MQQAYILRVSIMGIADDDSICLSHACIAQLLPIHGIALHVLEPAAGHQALPCRPVLQSEQAVKLGHAFLAWAPPHSGPPPPPPAPPV